MAERTYKPEEIVAKLCQVDVPHGRGKSMADAVRQVGVSEAMYYRWRNRVWPA
jgi:putative transposase